MVFLMFISFGFSLPLLILLMVEILWGIILMTPPPINIPAIKLAELTYTPTGKTVVYTLSAMMMVLLLAPLYDLARMAQAANVATSDSTTNPSTKLSGVGQATSLQADEGLQARTQLNLMLTMAAFTLLHFMRRMGAALGECSRLKSQYIDSHTEPALHPVSTPEIVENEPEIFKAAAFLPGDEAIMIQDEALKKEE